jgi:AraC family transcriptional regulator
MVDVQVICEAVDFIEANLKEAITVADVTEAVSYSLYHFAREFNQATHHTPYDYLMRRRLSESARDLVSTDRRIIDIAYDHQFNNPETFSRGCKRVFGMQPSRLRARGGIDRRLLTPRLRRKDIEHVLNGGCSSPSLETRDAARLVCLMTRARGTGSFAAGLWELCEQELRASGREIPAGERWAVCFYPSDWERHGFLYSVGVESDSTVPEPPLAVQELPAGQFVRFVHAGALSDVPLSLDYVYHTWAPRSDIALGYRLVLEHHRHDDAGRAGTHLYFPVQQEIVQ